MNEERLLKGYQFQFLIIEKPIIKITCPDNHIIMVEFDYNKEDYDETYDRIIKEVMVYNQLLREKKLKRILE